MSTMGKSSYKVYEDHDTYFITSTIIEWIPIFVDEVYCMFLIDSLKYCRQNKGLKVYYYVIMPDHFHVVINASANKVSGIIRDLKRFMSNKITQQLQQDLSFDILSRFSKAAKDKHQYQVWQSGFHPKAIISDDMLNQKMEYIHMNPVVAGLVDEPEEWKYSSARNIYLNDNSVIKLDDIGM